MKQILGYNAVVGDELKAFLRSKHDEAASLTPWKTDFLNRLLLFTTTGKLLRGSLVCFIYEAFSGRRATTKVIRAAAAVELTHSALLIHDDIMDNDALRRGQPSIHKQYESLGAKEKLADLEHFGASMAICVGDAASFLAVELLAGCPAPMQSLFTKQLIMTCAGQMQDLYLEAKPGIPSKEAIYDLMKTKTASYTLALPMAMGAALAEEPTSTLEQLQTIGVNAGVIFQIRDDELGVMGDTRETGKPVGSDIIEGKKTLLYYYLLKQSSARERLKIQSIFGNPSSSVEDIASIQDLVKHHGIAKLLNNEIEHLEAQAFADIGNLSAPSKAKKELLELVRFCGNRQS